MAAHAEFAAGDADENLVLDDERRRCPRRAFLRIGVPHRPDRRARRRIERDERRIRLIEEDPAIGVAKAAADRIAAHQGDDARLLARLIFPEDLSLMLEIQRIDGVGKGRVDVDDAADDERRPLMPAQYAGREGPDWRQPLHIAGVDLGQRRKAQIGEIRGPLRRHPGMSAAAGRREEQRQSKARSRNQHPKHS